MRPDAGPYEVQVRYRDSGEGPGKEWTTLQTNADGYFRFSASNRKSREWQAICELKNGNLLVGPFLRSYRFDKKPASPTG